MIKSIELIKIHKLFSATMIGYFGNAIFPFRMGELFGNSTKGMLGFIKSISYTYPDESPWETKPVTVEGKIGERGKVQYGRVPKYIMASIGFQVIHEEVPNLDTKFYGIPAVE